jgi:hypothetical protein
MGAAKGSCAVIGYDRRRSWYWPSYTLWEHKPQETLARVVVQLSRQSMHPCRHPRTWSQILPSTLEFLSASLHEQNGVLECYQRPWPQGSTAEGDVAAVVTFENPVIHFESDNRGP